MIRGTGKTQKRTAERRQNQHRLKRRQSTGSNAAYNVVEGHEGLLASWRR